jgi:4-amino-4-deoxy-L-arabinose transferase-like glycosyltransferase
MTVSSAAASPAGWQVFVTRAVEGVWLRRLAEAGIRPALLIAAIVFLMTFPLIVIRAYHFEEGLTVGIAKAVLEGRGPWYVPSLFGYRWIERPVLLSWLIAVISFPFAEVHQVVARIPVVLSLYAGALLIYGLVRDTASRTASLFAALCFLFSPIILNKVVTAESDVILSVTEFAAFVVWWRGQRAGHTGWGRWIAVGLLLGATALFKGPQPPAFFALGVGGYLLVQRQWRELPGYFLAGIISLGIVGAWFAAVYQGGDHSEWVRYMRLHPSPSFAAFLVQKADFVGRTFVSFLPPVILVIGGLVVGIWKSAGTGREQAGDLPLALGLYGGAALFVLLFWPNALPRYTMPAILAAAALAGLAFDPLMAAARARAWAGATIVTLTILMMYQGLWNWIIAPAAWEKFAASRLPAITVENTIGNSGLPIYAAVRSIDRIFAYLPQETTYLPRDALLAVKAPAWVLAAPATIDDMRRRRGDISITIKVTVPDRRRDISVARIEPK